MKTSHILLSYPLDKRGLLTLFHSRTYAGTLGTLVKNPRSDVLLLYGDRDEFTGFSSYETWVKELQGISGHDPSDMNSTVQVGYVKGATHFWEHSKAQIMLKVVEEWLDRRTP